jgi:GxxExxY protein
VIVELKTVEALLPQHDAQLLTYLKMTGIRLGYLINFDVQRLKTGIQRIVY